MNVSGGIPPDEELGRGVFSKRRANRARRDRVAINVFLIQEGRTQISVNKLTGAPAKEAVSIAEKRASDRASKVCG